MGTPSATVTSQNRVLWVAIIVLLLGAVGLGLQGSLEVALQYWYLLMVPVVLAALRFGRRGAIVVAGLGLLLLTTVFQASGQSFAQATGFLTGLIEATSSPQEAARLAIQLADLKAADPATTFARALLGMAIFTGSAVMLGNLVDHQQRGSAVLARLYQRLSQYCPPQIVHALSANDGDDSAPITSVRKEVTILFADIRDFSALTERMEPEEVAGLLNEFFTAMTEEVLREEGSLDKYIGDEIMAFFGDPVEHPDHPLRAFRAALAMQRRMRGLNTDWQAQGREPVGMGVGIATGHATVGVTGSPTRMEYTALGSIVNVASRLCDLALPEEILTTRKTYWRVQDLLDGVSRGPASVKGFTQPLELISIVGERALPGDGETASPSRWAELIAKVVDDPAYRGALLWNPSEARSLYPLSDEELRLAQHVAVLSGYPIFRDVGAGEIACLMAAGSIEEYPEGAVVVQQGAEESQFYLLLKGDVVIAVKDAQGGERHVASLSRGDHFGEVALLFDTPRTATVRTVSSSTALALHRDSFYSVLSRAPILRGNIEAAARARMARPFPLRTSSQSEGEAAASQVTGVA